MAAILKFSMILTLSVILALISSINTLNDLINLNHGGDDVKCGSYEGRITRLLSYCCQGYMYKGNGSEYNKDFSKCELDTYKYSLADLLVPCEQYAEGSKEVLEDKNTRELQTRLYLCDPATKPKLQIKELSKCYIEAVPKTYAGTDLSYFEDYTLSVLLNCYWQTYNKAPDMSLANFPNI